LAQHFLLSPAARGLSIAAVLRMTDDQAFDQFKRTRFAANGGEPYCPRCRCADTYTLNETPIRWKCAECRKKYSVTSGTIFHSRKLAIRDYLGVIALFCNGVKGTSALQMSRDMDINPKSAFVLLHKLREAMGATVHDGPELSGIVEVDFKHGEMTQRIYDALRERGEIASADIAVASMRDKGLDPDADPEPARTSCAASGCSSGRCTARASSRVSAKALRCDGGSPSKGRAGANCYTHPPHAVSARSPAAKHPTGRQLKFWSHLRPNSGSNPPDRRLKRRCTVACPASARPGRS
jgi:transposase-like protein